VKWVKKFINLFALKCSGIVRKFGQRISRSGAINLAFLSSNVLKLFRKRRKKARLRQLEEFVLVFTEFVIS